MNKNLYKIAIIQSPYKSPKIGDLIKNPSTGLYSVADIDYCCINRQEVYLLSTDKNIEKGDIVVLDWIGEHREEDLRVGSVTFINDICICLYNQYNNESRCKFEYYPNNEYYKVEASTEKLDKVKQLDSDFLNKIVDILNKNKENGIESNILDIYI